MLIYEITENPTFDKCNFVESPVTFQKIRPSRFSFFTSLRIATECKHKTPAAILTYNLTDTIAAVSARELRKDDQPLFPIFMYVQHMTSLPKSIPSKIAKNLSGMIFETESEKKRWESVRNFEEIEYKAVIPTPAQFEQLNIKSTFRAKSLSDLTIGYIGPIANGLTLKTHLEKAGRLDTDNQPLILVAGTAKARFIMPIVKRAKANKLNINWLGDDMAMNEIIEQIDAFIPSGEALSTIEKQALANGIPQIEMTELESLLDEETRNAYSLSSKELYNTMFKEKIVADKFKNLIIEAHQS